MIAFSKTTLAFGALGLGLGGAFLWLWVTNKNLTVQLATLKTDHAACTLSQNALRDHIDRQNKAIAVLKTQSDAQQKRIATAEKTAREKARAFLDAAEKWRHMPVDNDTCRAAESLLNAYLKEQL